MPCISSAKWRAEERPNQYALRRRRNLEQGIAGDLRRRFPGVRIFLMTAWLLCNCVVANRADKMQTFRRRAVPRLSLHTHTRTRAREIIREFDAWGDEYLILNGGKVMR